MTIRTRNHRRRNQIIDTPSETSFSTSPIRSLHSLHSFPDDDETDGEDLYDEFADLRELLPENDQQLVEKFNGVREFMVAEIPKIDDILNSNLPVKDKSRLLELFLVFLAIEPATIEWLGMKQEIVATAKSMNNNQKVRETMSLEEIAKMETELSRLENANDELNLDYKISNLQVSFEYKTQIFKKYKKLESMDPCDDEYAKLHDWILQVLQIPWGVRLSIEKAHIHESIQRLKKNLDQEFFGMKQVKEQILLYVHNRLVYPEMRVAALGLVGPHGVGKTSVIRAISESLTLPFYQISGGMLTNVDTLIGSSYVYVGSQMGEIGKALVQMKSMNGVLYIDEFEKIELGNCLATMLHLLDPVQNNTFNDRYVSLPIDLSQLWLVLSMNTKPVGPLGDRIFEIQMKDYTQNEKLDILEFFVVPKLLKHIDLPLKFTRAALLVIVQNAGDESGMRTVIQSMEDVVRKLCFQHHNKEVDVSFRLSEWEVDKVVSESVVRKLLHRNEKGGKNMMYV